MATSLQSRLDHTKRHDLRCEERGCLRPVYRLGRFCLVHHERNKAHGCPSGVSIRYRTIRAWRGLVEEVIDRNPDHPSIRAALDWFAGLQREALFRVDQGDRGQLWALIASQARHGVEPRELLSASATFHLLLELGLFRPSSTRHERFQFSRCVFFDWPSGRRPFPCLKNHTKERVHRLVTDAMGPLLIAIARKAAEDFNRPREAVMRRPSEPLN